MLKELEKKLGMELRGFTWIGPFTKPNYHHFVQFYGWKGEIYIQNHGIMSYPEYYKKLLTQGMCLYINGMIVARRGYSEHFNHLHICYLKKINMTQASKEESGYPVLNPNEKPIFESAVKLFGMGILSLEQLTERIKRYIQPEQQDKVLAAITQSAA